MLMGNITLYGDVAEKAKFLKENSGLFERILDVYMAGGVIGMVFNSKGEEKSDSNTVKIFAEQLNYESTRIKYLSSLAFLIENTESQYDEKELLKKTFGDWFDSATIEDSDNKLHTTDNKYTLFKMYAIEGIRILYDVIIKDSYDRHDYIANYYKFIKELDKLQVNDNIDRSIIGALVGDFN